MTPEQLKMFLHQLNTGYATRTGDARHRHSWVGHPANKVQKRNIEAADRLGLTAWRRGRAELSDAGRALLEALK